MKVSVIAPTRNRAELWRRDWLLSSLISQDKPPDELIVALDHTEDDTAADIADSVRRLRPPFPVTIIEVDKPRAQPFPASGYPDNCLFRAASGDVLLHVDDDITLPPAYIAQTHAQFYTLPKIAVWGAIQFVDDTGEPIPGDTNGDPRPFWAKKLRWPIGPCGLYQMPANKQMHWGAVFAVTRRDILDIGGHNLAGCGWHNTDTRLGNRLARYLTGSYVTSTTETTAKHLGLTWHMRHRHDRKVIAAAQSTFSGPKITNGGRAFWSSPWFDDAYHVREILG